MVGGESAFELGVIGRTIFGIVRVEMMFSIGNYRSLLYLS